tara:strand:- start:124 stop:543 length:420 start_codon:yes stop_codon:yes gene_type:complete
MLFKSICTIKYRNGDDNTFKFKQFDYSGGRKLKRWRAPRVVTPESLNEAISVGIMALAVRKQDRYAWQEEQIAKGVLQFIENVMLQAHTEMDRDAALKLEDSIQDKMKELYADMEVIQESRESYGMNRKMSRKAKLLAG